MLTPPEEIVTRLTAVIKYAECGAYLSDEATTILREWEAAIRADEASKSTTKLGPSL